MGAKNGAADRLRTETKVESRDDRLDGLELCFDPRIEGQEELNVVAQGGELPRKRRAYVTQASHFGEGSHLRGEEEDLQGSALVGGRTKFDLPVWSFRPRVL